MMAQLTLSTMVMRTNYMIEEIRRQAIETTWKQFKEADRRYYETCEGGREVTKLILELYGYGVDPDEITDVDLAIRDEVFGGSNND